MRTYNILKARAQAFDADPEVQDLIADPRDPAIEPHLAGGYSKDRASSLRALKIDAKAVAERGLRYEKLDQIMTEYMLGVR